MPPHLETPAQNAHKRVHTPHRELKCPRGQHKTEPPTHTLKPPARCRRHLPAEAAHTSPRDGHTHTLGVTASRLDTHLVGTMCSDGRQACWSQCSPGTAGPQTLGPVTRTENTALVRKHTPPPGNTFRTDAQTYTEDTPVSSQTYAKDAQTHTRRRAAKIVRKNSGTSHASGVQPTLHTHLPSHMCQDTEPREHTNLGSRHTHQERGSHPHTHLNTCWKFPTRFPGTQLVCKETLVLGTHNSHHRAWGHTHRGVLNTVQFTLKPRPTLRMSTGLGMGLLSVCVCLSLSVSLTH